MRLFKKSFTDLLISSAFSLLLFSCIEKNTNQIDISGEWKFQIDSLDLGIRESWFTANLSETVNLPGSMAENGKGNNISVLTQWTGDILDSSWYFDEKYEKYRSTGNVKIPFWLQPDKHYIGAAWYQKQIEIPQNWAGRNVEVYFERAHWETQIWLDDKAIGMRNSLATPHLYELGSIQPGKHVITIRVDNSIKDIDPGSSAHSISDQTQTNWNGIIGDILVISRPNTDIDKIKLYPDVAGKKVVSSIKLKNTSGEIEKFKLMISVHFQKDGAQIGDDYIQSGEITDSLLVDIKMPMGDDPKLWDEFNPNLYSFKVKLVSAAGEVEESVSFGMRDFKVDGKHFTINDRPVFLRGTLECAIFPLTGYPPTDVMEWKRILEIVKDHGLNHVRFHSWCPPKAAFIAADEIGVYLQVEASSWANTASSKLGAGNSIDKWIFQEGEDILDAYGNHPSFSMMAYGNEPGGENMDDYLESFVDHFQNLDSTKLYTGGAGWPLTANADFYNNAKPRIQAWGGGLNSIINKRPPQTEFDYNNLVNSISMPYVSHEMGQWCVYPNFKEISKYTGVLKPKNFEIFKETLHENHMGQLSDSLLLASGKLQVLCYKADIEAGLRTKDLAGFQLLDLHDFPGQGTALVGVLDAFWDEKGYITPAEYRRFSGQTVPLVRLSKRIYLNNEELVATAELAHFGEFPFQNTQAEWKLVGSTGNLVSGGVFDRKDFPIGNGIRLGEIRADLSAVDSPGKLILSVRVDEFENSWDVWVYPSVKDEISSKDEIRLVDQLDGETLDYLEEGGKVLFSPKKGTIAPEKGGNVGIGFSSIFWNTAYTNDQKPHTLGILCDPQHSAFVEFPTEYHSNWQWWDAMSHSQALIIDEWAPDLKPIVRVIDDWFTNRQLALVFEAKVGKGYLIVSGVDFFTNMNERIEAQQLLYSFKKYMHSENFQPSYVMDRKDVIKLTQLN